MVKAVNTIAIAALLAAMAVPALAEDKEYGEVWLGGLARGDWALNPGFKTHLGMVCNVNGPDGFLSIRSGPGADFKALRKLNRLAIVEVDVSERRGRWVRVIDAYREVSPQGIGIPFKHLPVQGWAHDGYLCSFIH